MIDQSIYVKRRQQVAKFMQDDSIAIIDAAPEAIRNNDSAYRYRQCSNFYYLTGYNKPDAILIIHKNKRKSFSHFFSKKPNKHDSIWTGELYTNKKILSTYGFGKSYYLDNFSKELMLLLKKSCAIYHSLNKISYAFHVLDDCMNYLEKDYRQRYYADYISTYQFVYVSGKKGRPRFRYYCHTIRTMPRWIIRCRTRAKY